jgi:hypothetical protein
MLQLFVPYYSSFFLKVDTIFGFPPGFPAFRFLTTADRFSPLLIAAAERAGLHFGYFDDPPFRSFLPAEAPHGGCLPVLGSFLEISTHF